MNLETMKMAMENVNPGCNVRAEWMRPAKTYKGVTERVEKSVSMAVRVGCQWDRIQGVKDARANGDAPAVNQGLSGVEWVMYPYLLISLKTGKIQVRMNASSFPNTKTIVRWYLNGVEVPYCNVENLILSSEKPHQKDDKALFGWNLNIDSLLRLGNTTQEEEEADMVVETENA